MRTSPGLRPPLGEVRPWSWSFLTKRLAGPRPGGVINQRIADRVVLNTLDSKANTLKNQNVTCTHFNELAFSAAFFHRKRANENQPAAADEEWGLLVMT
jgi:hypothetical protein